MTKSSSAESAIRLRGVRHNNLKNFDLDIPIGQLTVITGLSGSGKSSLAFDTLFAEGQRRYIETFSPYARQFFDRMDKPQVDRIDGIPPAIAIEQRNAVRTTRSTVGTMTELCDYMKLLWLHIAKLQCQKCGQPVRKEPPSVVWDTLNADPAMKNAELLITFNLSLSEKLSLKESLDLIARQGYQRLFSDGQILRLDEAVDHPAFRVASSRLTVVQDRLKLTDANRARFTEACEHAYHFGQGQLCVHRLSTTRSSGNAIEDSRYFSSGFHCATCDLDYREPTAALFSFNNPVGACPDCKGFGRVISIDYDLAIPDSSKTLAEGCVKPWQVGHGLESQRDLMTSCKKRKIPTNVPFRQLPPETQKWVIEGDPDYDADEPHHSWPKAWYGVKGYFRWLESKAYKMHVRVLLSRYRAYTLCPTCAGTRLKPEALLYRVSVNSRSVTSEPVVSHQSPTTHSPETDPLNTDYSLSDFYALPIDDALKLIDHLAGRYSPKSSDPLGLAFNEVRARLGYLAEVGLGYLTLDRPTRTLSGGETERVNLTTCLGTRLVNTLFVLDEPSVGLHPRDTARLVRILHQLRDAGNTVVVVEHEASVMRAADQIVDLGPGQGEKGGSIVFCGSMDALLKSERSLTGQYLSGRKQVEAAHRREVRNSVVAESRSSQGGIRLREESEASEVIASSDNPPALAEATLPYRSASSVPGFVVRTLTISNASRHNLRNLTVEIPLGRLVALTGVSGSGKTTLVREILLPALQARLKAGAPVAKAKASDRLDPNEGAGDEPSAMGLPPSDLEGWQHLREVVLVDQSSLGKTPRSNPVVYIGAFEEIRELFAQVDLAKQRGLNASAFSFNSGVGQCERCRGAGFEKIEMQFLSDIFIRCPECNGRRYRGHILEVKLRGPRRRAVSESVISNRSKGSETSSSSSDSLNTDLLTTEDWSIADVLEATVDDALTLLLNFIHLLAGRRAFTRLKLLQDVGLGYLRLGQPINTLSGGESQRLKLVSHLAESAVSRPRAAEKTRANAKNTREEVKQWLVERRGTKTDRDSVPVVAQPGSLKEIPPSDPWHTLFLFDEPTTGLHFDDVRVLLQVFQRIVDAGHSVVVIEHNLDVIKCADWIIDLGPDAGERGGELVVCGTPEEVAACEASHTGHFLRQVLPIKPTVPKRLPLLP